MDVLLEKEPRVTGAFLSVASARLRGLGFFAVFYTALIAKIASFLRLLLAFRRLAVFVKFLFDETRSFLSFTSNAHCTLLCEASQLGCKASVPDHQFP